MKVFKNRSNLSLGFYKKPVSEDLEGKLKVVEGTLVASFGKTADCKHPELRVFDADHAIVDKIQAYLLFFEVVLAFDFAFLEAA